MSKSKSKTAIVIGVILLLSVIYKFFIGMEKVSYVVFSDATRFPSNISRDMFSLIAWVLVVQRLHAHKAINSATFWSFIVVIVTQVLDYFLVGGQLGAYRLLFFPITYLFLTLWKRK